MEGIVSHVKVTNGIQNRRGMIRIYILKSSFWLSCGQWDFAGKKKQTKKKAESPNWRFHSIHVRGNGGLNHDMEHCDRSEGTGVVFCRSSQLCSVIN